MYEPGYNPTETAKIDGLKSYRNDVRGIFFHKCRNIVLVNGLFADNILGVDIDRAEGIEVRDTVIIGQSESFRTLMARQPSAKPPCLLKGLELHTWKIDYKYAGSQITNVDFSGFGDLVTCQMSYIIHYDYYVSARCIS